MKNKLFTSFLLLVIVSISIISCNKVPAYTRYVPKNALAVISINMDNLAKKLIWNAITGSELFDEMQKDIKNEESKKAMKDIGNIGLDPTSQIFIFYTGDMKNENNACMLTAMKDALAFESFITKNYPDIKIEDKQQYKTCRIEEKFILTWNKEVIIGGLVTETHAEWINDSLISKSDNAELISAYLGSLYTMGKENAITNLSNFNKLIKDDHDFGFWINYEELYNKSQEFNTAEIKAFIKPEYMKEAALAGGFNFNKGAIDMIMDYYFSGKLAEIYKKHEMSGVDKSLIENLPSQKIALLVAYNLKPQMIEDYLKEFKLDGLANLGLATTGLDLETLMNTFKGDMVFALSDLKQVSKTENYGGTSYTHNEPEMDLLFSMKLNDVNGLKKVLDLGIKENAIQKNGNEYTMNGSDDYMLIHDNNKLIASNKKELARSYFAGKENSKNAFPESVWSHITSNPISFYADVNEFMKLADDGNKSETDAEIFNYLKSMFTYAEIYGGKLKNNANHLEGALYFQNKDENAMIQLINLGMKIKKLEDKKNATAAEASKMEAEVVEKSN